MTTTPTPQLKSRPTEAMTARYADIDAWPINEALDAMVEGQFAAVAAVREAIPHLTAAVEAAIAALGAHDRGRLVYVGAGTSGRVALQDGAELPPTFDWPSERLVFMMAGGLDAVLKAAEGAEDQKDVGIKGIADADIGPSDVVIGLAASGTTPYTLGAIEEATRRGAVSIGIANNPDTPILKAARFPVLLHTGAEAVAGSTRMKAGTAQKIALNLLSTEIMIRLGRVYRGLMVHMRAKNVKLRQRSELIVAQLTGCSPATAAAALGSAEGDLKLAVLLAMGFAIEDARASLATTSGRLRDAIEACSAQKLRSLL